MENVEIIERVDGERVLAINLRTLADHILDEDLVGIADVAREIDLATRLAHNDPECAREMLARVAVRRYEYLRRFPALRETYISTDQLALRMLAVAADEAA